MRRPWLCLLPLLLGGCALPPMVTVASLAADGMSYIATGKSVTDHAISGLTGEDCALLYVVDDGAICRDAARPGPDSAPAVTVVAAAAIDDTDSRFSPAIRLREAREAAGHSARDPRVHDGAAAGSRLR